MLDLNDFFLLVQVVDRGGFTAAGRTLRMPKSTPSHRIQELEANLGVEAAHPHVAAIRDDRRGPGIPSPRGGDVA